MNLALPFYQRLFKSSNSIIITETECVPKARSITDEIIRLFEAGQNNEHKRVATSQMIRCAMLAMENMSDLPVIIAALLHNIGYLVTHQQTTSSLQEHYLKSYADESADFLWHNGFSERVCTIVKYQPQAQRYLVTTDKSYMAQLAPATRRKIQQQGGAMDSDEMAAFEIYPWFLDIVNVGRWQACEQHTPLLPISYFNRILLDHLWYRTVPINGSPFSDK